MKKIGLIILMVISGSWTMALANNGVADKVLYLTADDMPLVIGDGSETLLDIEVRNFFPIQQAFGLDETVVEISENSANCKVANDFALQTWDDNKTLKIVVITYAGKVSVSSNGQSSGGCTIVIRAKKTSEVLHTIEYKFAKN